MKNPIHKRLEKFESWQHITFMASLCERMYPNFKLFCQVTEQPEKAKVYQSILNLVWEYLTVKEAKINFDNQLEKLESIIPDMNDYDCFGVVVAVDACEGLAELVHSIIGGYTLEQAIKISQLSLQTVVTLLETQEDRHFSEQELKNTDEIQQELDMQWHIYRMLNKYEKRDLDPIILLKTDLKNSGISNIGIEIAQ